MTTLPAVQCPRCRTRHLADTGCPVCTPRPVRYTTTMACGGAVRPEEAKPLSEGDRLWDEAFANTTPEEWARLEARMIAAEERARKSAAAPKAPVRGAAGGCGASEGEETT